MNPYKKTNGWILCPSKSFPGKFYYFNVANGETAWSLNEAEKKSIKNPPFQRVDNLHSYPEPSSPPVDIPPITTQPTVQNPKDINVNYPNRNLTTNVSTLLIQPTHTFGQSNFSKPAQPIQIQVPMRIGSDYQSNTPQVFMIFMNQMSPKTQLAIEEPKYTSNTHIQTYPNTEPDRELFIQTGTVPLSKRFVNYEQPVINFKGNKIEKLSLNKLYDTSTPNKSILPEFPHNQSNITSMSSSNNNFANNQTKPLIRDAILSSTPKRTPEKCQISNPNMFITSPLSNSTLFVQSPHSNINIFAPSTSHGNTIDDITSPNKTRNIFNANQDYFPAPLKNQSNRDIFKKPFNIETNPFKKLPDKEKSTLKPKVNINISKTQISANVKHFPSSFEEVINQSKTCIENSTLIQDAKVLQMTTNENKDVRDLDENDLRRILMAKKRKSIDFGDINTIEGKKIKATMQEDSKSTAVNTKKKVTFNLDPETYSDTASMENLTCVEEDITYNEERRRQELEHIAASEKTDTWFAVVDTNMLLQEFELLNSFVRLDPKCQLLIPSRVMSDTIALSRGECRERSLVTLARHSLRRLAVPDPQIIVQGSEFEGNMSTEDSILHCCLEAMELNSHVILLTNNENLQYNAETLKILYFNTQQIKDSTKKQPEVHFDIKKMKISIPNAPSNVECSHEPTETYKNVDSTSESASEIQDNYSTHSIEFPFSSNDIINASKAECTNTKGSKVNDMKKSNIKVKPVLLQIQKDVKNSQVKKIQTTLNKETPKTVPNSNETVSFSFQNENSKNNLPEIDKTIDSENTSRTISSFFQNRIHNKEEQRISNIFKQANDKLNRINELKRKESQTKSIFEIDNDQRLLKNSQKPSIFKMNGIEKNQTGQDKIKTICDDNFRTNKLQKPSIFENETYKNSELPLKRTIFMKDQLPNKDNLTKSPVFKLENYKNKEVPLKSSIFEIEKYKNKVVQLKTPVYESEKYKNKEPQLSVFENDKFKNKGVPLKPPIYDNEKYKNKDVQLKTNIIQGEKYKNKEVQLKPPIFYNEKYKNKDDQLKTNIIQGENYKNKEVQLKPPVFETEKYKNKDVQLKRSIFDIDTSKETMGPNEINNVDVCVEEYFTRFCGKNKNLEDRIEERKEELICGFNQVMEECLTNVLQLSTVIHETSPPWTLSEALQCILKVYGSHTTVRTIVNTMSGVLNAKAAIIARDFIKCIGCGLMLVRCLKNIIHVQSTSEVLTDTEEALNTILKGIVSPNTCDVTPVKPPAFSRSDIVCDEQNQRRNFVKGRSEVLNYLKRNFPAWANYDETLEDATSKSAWGQKYKDVKVLRTLGKDLSLLKINKTKTITMIKPTDEAKTMESNIKDPPIKEKEDKQEKIVIKQNKNTQDDNNNKTDVKTNQIVDNRDVSTTWKDLERNSPTKLNKKFGGLKLIRKIEKKPKADTQNDKSVANNANFEGTNQRPDVKHTEPKIIRLFDNIKLIKEQNNGKTAIDSAKSNFDMDFATHGHTFGTDEKSGPKIVRNIKIIEEFEKKFKSIREPLDLDELDYSAIPNNEDQDSLENTDKDCISMNIDYEEEKNLIETSNNVSIKNQPNPLNDATNDKKALSKYDTQNVDSSVNGNNSYATNNESHSMSFDNCVTNDCFYATNDVGNYATNDSHRDRACSNIGNYATNDSHRDRACSNIGNYATNDSHRDRASSNIGNYATNDSHRDRASSNIGNYATNDSHRDRASSNIGNYATNDSHRDRASSNIGNYATNDSHRDRASSNIGNYATNDSHRDRASSNIGNYATNDSHRDRASSNIGNYATNDSHRDRASSNIGNYATNDSHRDRASSNIGNYATNDSHRDRASSNIGNYATNDSHRDRASSNIGNFATNDSHRDRASSNIGNYATNDSHRDRASSNDGNYATNDNSSMNDKYFSLDYVSCMTNIISNGTNDDFYTPNDNHGPNYMSFETNNDSYATNDECTKVTHKDDTTNDSGFENESMQAYSLVKSFLYEVNGSFMLVHKFVEGSMQSLKDDTISDGKRRMLYTKANSTHAQIKKIIERLISIIERESGDGTMLKLLAGAGAQVSTDIRIIRYRQIVTKCLEEAQMLERALRVMLSVTEGSTDSLSFSTNK